MWVSLCLILCLNIVELYIGAQLQVEFFVFFDFLSVLKESKNLLTNNGLDDLQYSICSFNLTAVATLLQLLFPKALHNLGPPPPVVLIHWNRHYWKCSNVVIVVVASTCFAMPNLSKNSYIWCLNMTSIRHCCATCGFKYMPRFNGSSFDARDVDAS